MIPRFQAQNEVLILQWTSDSEMQREHRQKYAVFQLANKKQLATRNSHNMCNSQCRCNLQLAPYHFTKIGDSESTGTLQRPSKTCRVVYTLHMIHKQLLQINFLSSWYKDTAKFGKLNKIAGWTLIFITSLENKNLVGISLRSIRLTVIPHNPFLCPC